MSETTDPTGGTHWQSVLGAKTALDQALAAGDPQAIEEARLAHGLAHERWANAVAEAAGTVAAPAPPAAPDATDAAAPANLNGHLWRMSTDTGLPPMEEELGPAPLPRVGICLSGGGSRSMTASMGELRALRKLGLLDRVSFISSVSGGSWAATSFTYLPDVIDDDTFLGPVIEDPRQLVWGSSWGHNGPNSLLSLSRYCMGYAATQISILGAVEIAWRRYQAGDPPHLLWQRAIGELILGQFGLGDGTSSGSPAQYYSYTRSWLERVILANNRGLNASQFRLVRGGRPYLIVNSALFYPPPVGLGTPRADAPLTELYPFELTPMGAGLVPTFNGAGQGQADLGGGYVDPFVFGSTAPAQPVGVSGEFTVPTPPYRFALSDMTGTSSAAFTEIVIQKAEELGFKALAALDPYYLYWPVKPAGEQNDPANPYYLGDGGILENIGITPLLRRRIPSIIAFANTSEPLQQHLSLSGFHQIRVSSDLPPLFGYQPWTAGQGYQPIPSNSSAAYAHNQVFPSSAFPELVMGLWNAYQAGGTALVKQKLTTVENRRFGVPAGDTPTVLWVHLNPVTRFHAALSAEIRDWMYVDPYFWNFPNFNTVTELTLGTRQVTLLGHLACWNVLQNASVFRSMFPT